MDKNQPETITATKVEEKPERRGEKLPYEIEALLSEVAGLEKIDEKMRHVLAFMRHVLEKGGEGDISLFWKARTQCMELFKESMLQATRSVLWSEYVELVEEARRIKEVLDEQAAFAVEQIEMAIDGMENDLRSMPELHMHGAEGIFPPFADNESLSDQEQYLAVQKELDVLNAFAAKVQVMRKEVIHTGMRLKLKNRFFVRLSACGDLIFPRRKELIGEISKLFSADVGRFVDAYFTENTKEVPNYTLREEIKKWQELAKRLTVNTQTFVKTRKVLSGAWEQLKERDKERKANLAKKKKAQNPLFAKKREEEAVFSKEGEIGFLEALEDLLEKRRIERARLKNQVEKLRVQIGGSGLDFEQAMQLREAFEKEKKDLQHMDASIETIQDHIDKLG